MHNYEYSSKKLAYFGMKYKTMQHFDLSTTWTKKLPPEKKIDV